MAASIFVDSPLPFAGLLLVVADGLFDRPMQEKYKKMCYILSPIPLTYAKSRRNDAANLEHRTAEENVKESFNNDRFV